MPHRRSAPRPLPSLSLVVLALFASHSCAGQGHAKQEPPPSRPASASAARAALFSPPSLPSSSSSSSLSPLPLGPAADPDLPSADASGYVPNGGADRGGGLLFFTYYEKKNGSTENDPIFLWLEGGPGCASSFGNFYINGPARALAARDGAGTGGQQQRRATGKLKQNPHAWNALGGLLYIDQPVGTGFSVPGGAGTAAIPRTEVEVAADLYFGLCELFGPGGALEALAPRPLFVTGESYAGKFVPSIAHYILQVEAETETETETGGGGGGGSRRRRRAAAAAGAAGKQLRVRRELRRERDASSGAALPLRPPPFHLAGIAVGNGLVDPGSQVLSHASSLYYRGLIDSGERARTMAAALQVSALVRASAFSAAHAARARLLERLSAASGVGTLLDARRYEDYDAGNAVDQYLNLPAVRAALRVNESLYDLESSSSYKACSAEVAAAMDGDVMRSTAGLFPDLLDAGVRVLVYVGADDVQDGAAATDAWLSRLRWGARREFSAAPRRHWRLREAVVDDEAFGSGCTDAEGGSSSFSPFSGGPEGSGVAAAVVATGSLVDVDVDVERAALSPSPSSGEEGASDEDAPVVGYWREGGGLSHVTVRNGGHMLPHDQPVVSLAMLSRWSAGGVPAAGSSGGGAGSGSGSASFSPSATAA